MKLAPRVDSREERGTPRSLLPPPPPPPPPPKKKKKLKEGQLTIYLSSAKKVPSVRNALQILEGLNGGVTLTVDG